MKASSSLTSAGILASILAHGPVQFSGSLFAQQPIPLNAAALPGPTKGFGKMGIEFPTKRLIAGATSASPDKKDFVNPKVPAGKVRWHSSFDAARKAAQKSGKPVLLFQMMGKLVEQFC